MLERRTIRRSGPGRDNLFGWTVFLLLLAAFAAVSWVGSFYIFGHPERAFSYGVLRAVGKIDEPKRFELTKAPRGEFLDADKLAERFGKMPPRELDELNATLLRNYLRNYSRTRDLIPYVTGDYRVLGAFKLGPDNFFPDGVVALARSKQNPSVLLELVFPAAEADAGELERMLRMGLELQLRRTLDLAALVNARIMPDGRLNLTAVPLLYGSYTSTSATGTLNLEPPAGLNVSAGLPVLNQAAVDEAEKRYAAHVEGAGEPANGPSLMRVQRTEAVEESTIPVVRAEAVRPPPPPPVAPAAPAAAPPVTDNIPVARAVPVNALAADRPVLRAEPVRAAPAVPVAPAQPVDGVPVRRAEAVVPLQPFDGGAPPATGE
jgi:hypothetical protein